MKRVLITLLLPLFCYPCEKAFFRIRPDTPVEVLENLTREHIQSLDPLEVQYFLFNEHFLHFNIYALTRDQVNKFMSDNMEKLKKPVHKYLLKSLVSAYTPGITQENLSQVPNEIIEEVLREIK